MHWRMRKTNPEGLRNISEETHSFVKGFVSSRIKAVLRLLGAAIFTNNIKYSKDPCQQGLSPVCKFFNPAPAVFFPGMAQIFPAILEH